MTTGTGLPSIHADEFWGPLGDVLLGGGDGSGESPALEVVAELDELAVGRLLVVALAGRVDEVAGFVVVVAVLAGEWSGLSGGDLGGRGGFLVGAALEEGSAAEVAE